MRKLVATLGLLLAISACSAPTPREPSAERLCNVASQIRSGGVLSDDLLSLPATAGELENRLRGAVVLLDELGVHLESESLRAEASKLKLAIAETVVALSSFGFEQSNLVANGNPEERGSLEQIGSEDVTSARIRLVAVLEAECGQTFDVPTAAISVLNTPGPAVEPIRRTEITPSELTTEELTTLLSSGLGSELEEALLSSTGVREMSDLLEALREGQLELSSEEYGLISQALRRDEYGDDVPLDRLWDACEQGDFEACDLLWYQSPRATAYERYGATCGERIEDEESANKCAEVLS